MTTPSPFRTPQRLAAVEAVKNELLVEILAAIGGPHRGAGRKIFEAGGISPRSAERISRGNLKGMTVDLLIMVLASLGKRTKVVVEDSTVTKVVTKVAA